MTELPQRQLDEVSRVIGSMESSLDNLEKYVHEWRHDEDNYKQQQVGTHDLLLVQMGQLRKDIQADIAEHKSEAAAVRVADRMELDGIKREVELLKGTNLRREGTLGAIDYVLKSPLIGWVVAFFAALWAFATGRIHP